VEADLRAVVEVTVVAGPIVGAIDKRKILPLLY
jgi:hypothetical protein